MPRQRVRLARRRTPPGARRTQNARCPLPQLSETGDTLAEGWNYMNDRRDELYDQQSENFSQRWDNGEYGSALLGYTGDMFAIPLWKQPFSAGGLFRAAVDSIQELETQEVLDAREAGEDGKADAMVAWNALGMFISPLDRLKIPDTPGGGSRGNGNDEGSSNEESTDQDNKDEDNNNPNCTDNSFTPGTPVLAANGSTVPIEDIDIGDEVLAFDPATGEEGPREVTDTITGDGQKTLVDITVTDTDDNTSTLTATPEHPFWAPKAGTWVDAINLEPGTWLRTSTGTWPQTTATDTRTVADQQVHNLTINDLHTYYVLTGSTEVLVHNQNNGNPCNLPPQKIRNKSLNHSFDRHAEQWFGREVTKGAKIEEWRSLIERASNNKNVVSWRSGGKQTNAYLSKIDGKWFAAQYDKQGNFVTDFMPNQKQMRATQERLNS